MTSPIPIERRFWSKVELIPFHTCWEWAGSLDREGYGRLRQGGKFGANTILVHRLSWLLHNGELPKAPLTLRHTCDNRSCVNPDHLLPGTQADNNKDMFDRGRWTPIKGEKHWNARLEESQVREIRGSSESGVVLAHRYGVTPQMICRIRKRHAWRHI